MNSIIYPLARWLAAVTTLLLSAAALPAWAAIDGITGTVFNLTARRITSVPAMATAFITGATPMALAPCNIRADHDREPGRHRHRQSYQYAAGAGLHRLSRPAGGCLQCGSAGLITREAAANGGTVTYTFTATHAGTYQYHSGTQPAVQVEMGLVGALIVRPSGVADPLHQAYAHPDTAFAREHLFVLTEIDPLIHEQLMFNPLAVVDTSDYRPVYWFINAATRRTPCSKRVCPGCHPACTTACRACIRPRNC